MSVLETSMMTYGPKFLRGAVDADLLAEALERAAHNRRSHWSVEGQTAARQTLPAFTLGSFLDHDNS